MIRKDLVIGEYYRHKATPNYSWAKILEIIEPHTGVNNNNYPVAKCELTVDKGDTFGMIKYFKLSNLIKEGGK
jgi:hypothetical protein